MKMRTTVLVFSFFLCGIAPVYAQSPMPDEAMHGTDPQTTVATVDNKVCPVTGKKIPKEDLGKYGIEYKGKIYNLCSEACKGEFMKDPDTYAARAEESVAKTEARQSEESGEMPDNLSGMEDGPLMDETDNGPAD